MHKEVLTESQMELIPLLRNFAKEFYLVGGTAIALYIGHRRSIDFDLFTKGEIHRFRIKKEIEKSGFQIEQVLYEAFDQVHFLVNSVKLTFFHFPYPIDYANYFEDIIAMPSLLDLAAMKAFSLGGLAKWKDYVDLYFIFKNYFCFKEVATRASSLFKNEFNEKLFREQLAYFEDVDHSEPIDFVANSINEAEIKTFLTDIALTPFS